MATICTAVTLTPDSQPRVMMTYEILSLEMSHSPLWDSPNKQNYLYNYLLGNLWTTHRIPKIVSQIKRKHLPGHARLKLAQFSNFAEIQRIRCLFFTKILMFHFKFNNMRTALLLLYFTKSLLFENIA